MGKNGIVKTGIRELVVRHPLLVKGLALTPAAMAAYSLKNALAISFLFFLPLIICGAFNSLLGHKLSSPIRKTLTALLGCGLMIPSILAAHKIFPYRISELGAYVPLLSISTLILVMSEEAADEGKLFSVLIKNVSGWLGWSTAVCLLGAFREIFGTNTLFDFPVPFPLQLNSMAMPFSALIVLAFLSAFLNVIREKIKVSEQKSEGSGD